MEILSGIRRIEKNFDEVLTLLDGIDKDNFNGKMERINFLYNDISKQKALLRRNYSYSELKKI